MNTSLWIIQILLSILMLFLGFIKTFLPVEMLRKFSWTTHSSKPFVRFVGVSELLIGIGLIVPQLTGVLRVLTSCAAMSLSVIMLLAIAEHIRQKEGHELWKNAIILLLATFVAVGRFIA